MSVKKTTTIYVNPDHWDVPRGFGREYMRLARIDRDTDANAQAIRDLLELVGYTADVKAIRGWPLRKRVEATAYAANVYGRASDNPIPAHPKPEWFGVPWSGPRSGAGIFEGPGPTVVT